MRETIKLSLVMCMGALALFVHQRPRKQISPAPAVVATGAQSLSPPVEHSTWSVRFSNGPHPTRLVYDKDDGVCYCEGTLQEAFDGVVNSQKHMSDYYARRLYGDKQVDEWDAEAKKGFQWP